MNSTKSSTFYIQFKATAMSYDGQNIISKLKNCIRKQMFPNNRIIKQNEDPNKTHLRCNSDL